MASFAIAPPPHHHPLSSLVPCKFSSNSNPFKFRFSTSISGIGGNINLILAKLSTANHEPCSSTANFITSEQSGSEVRTLSPRDEKSRKESLKELVTSIIKEKTGKRFSEGPNMKGVLRDKNGRSESSSTQESEIVDTSSSLSSRNGDVAVRFLDDSGRSNSSRLGHGKVKKRNSGNCSDDAKDEASVSRRLKKNKIESPEPQVRVALDMCSKRGDFLGAIELYDWARKEGIALGQYHYTLLLYLCSSAAIGVIQPAKSGSGARTLNGLDFSGDDLATDQVKFDKAEDGNELLAIEMQMQSVSGGSMLKGKVGLTSSLSNGRVVHTFKEIKGTGQNPNGFSKPKGHVLDRLNDLRDAKDGAVNQEEQAILLDEKIKEYALERGFEIYKEMCLKEVPMNEATLTSVARMAMSLSDGNMAFNMVKQMKSLGINPRLRSYGPALSAFCNSGDIEKAFEVEKHMLENGVYPEEPELQALLRVSIVAGKGDNVYYLLHKLRASVRRVSPSTADLIEEWFKSKVASRLGKRKWDKGEIKEAVENGGGGWHGKGWLGRGKWTVSHASVGPDGSCRCCGEKLATIDLDPMETENFADSVAAMAIKREKNSSFQKFQKWLDYYGPFEAVIDGANVGLFSQQRFLPAKVNVVVNGIRQKLPSKRWPLIVLHNKRITGNKMDVPVNKAIIEKWKNADALYLTPTGSNDDWYWLYAAIKFKCLIVTNDEMRDHTFQLLGNDFFPKWKERHQVHFSFSDTGPEFHMPPPCSVVIQESENGHWHIPISLEDVYEEDRQWLCIKRVSSRAEISPEGMQPDHQNNEHEMQDSRSEQIIQANHDSTIRQTPEIYKNLRSIFSASVLSRDCTLASELETAERLGRCIIDFQI